MHGGLLSRIGKFIRGEEGRRGGPDLIARRLTVAQGVEQRERAPHETHEVVCKRRGRARRARWQCKVVLSRIESSSSEARRGGGTGFDRKKAHCGAGCGIARTCTTRHA